MLCAARKQESLVSPFLIHNNKIKLLPVSGFPFGTFQLTKQQSKLELSKQFSFIILHYVRGSSEMY